ncbi:TPA: type VI secretion system tip protein VgrG, partial [Salmonella enterica]|nr:type VI secretion system tip protein VgrG [Salmonella enterica]
MSQNGLRFTLDVDGLTQTATAVVSFTLYQHLSTPFLLTVDIASDRSGLTAVSFLEKNATLTIWQGDIP